MSESYSGGTPSVGVKEYYGGQIPFIRSAEINSEITELFLTEEGLKNSSARLVAVGDILYALYGATSGEVGRARFKGAINQAILAIKPHTDYDSEYLAQWLRKSKHSIIETYLQGGQGNLSGTIVKELSVDFPSLKEQKVIGDFFRQLDNLITLHQCSLNFTKIIIVKYLGNSVSSLRLPSRQVKRIKITFLMKAIRLQTRRVSFHRMRNLRTVEQCEMLTKECIILSLHNPSRTILRE